MITTFPKKKQLTKSDPVYKAFEDFIIKQDHPCIMAQSVFNDKMAWVKPYDRLGTRPTAERMMRDLSNFVDTYDFTSRDFKSFIAAFPEEEFSSEEVFEDLLWQQLQYLHETDNRPWDPEVSSDPESPNFSFSLAGKAFYVVGMHPQSRRWARQSPYPAIVFNLHWQFEKLREMNTYETVKNRIRDRDRMFQGYTNPMLKDFGLDSEAKQYSGRSVQKSWKCPFLHKKTTSVS